MPAAAAAAVRNSNAVAVAGPVGEGREPAVTSGAGVAMPLSAPR